MEALTGEHNLADCAIVLVVMVYMTNRLAESAENHRKREAVRVKGKLKRDSWGISEAGNDVYKLGQS